MTFLSCRSQLEKPLADEIFSRDSHANGKVLRASGAEQSQQCGEATGNWRRREAVSTKTVPNCTKNGISDSENPDDALLLTDSFERCYVPEVALLAGVAKLAYAADSKTRFCSFCPLRNSSQQLETKEEKNTDDLRPFFGILGNF